MIPTFPAKFNCRQGALDSFWTRSKSGSKKAKRSGIVVPS